MEHKLPIGKSPTKHLYYWCDKDEILCVDDILIFLKENSPPFPNLPVRQNKTTKKHLQRYSY